MLLSDTSESTLQQSYAPLQEDKREILASIKEDLCLRHSLRHSVAVIQNTALEIFC